jgi:hypothetical protein
MNNIIAIGGLGGSGTRVVASMLQSSGIYLGSDLNDPLDNLLFTRIFKNPALYKSNNNLRINKLLDIFSKKMQGQSLSFFESISLARAMFSNRCYSSSIREIYSVLTQKPDRTASHTWAWKEPNTHIYVHHILKRYPTCKYIHVLRNGLDMKHSSNIRQSKNWSFLFSLEQNGLTNQWDFWVMSTQRIQEVSKSFPSRVYIINYNNLCTNPTAEVTKLFQFLEIELTNKQLNKLSAIPKVTPQKHTQEDIQLLTLEETKLLKEWGFTEIS